MIAELTFTGASILLFQTIRYYRGLKTSEKWLEKKDKGRGKNRTISILIPVYKEEKIILSTIKYFHKIAKKNVKIIFITTRKEGPSKKNKTLQLLKKNKFTSMQIMHSPNISGAKATQINFALSKIQKKKTHYIAIFDVDSRPEKKVFEYILKDVDEPAAYQMPSLYLSKGSSFDQAAALHQTRWMLCYELPRLINNWRLKKIKQLTYFVGHGLFLRSDYLKEFPETLSEDITLGYEWALEGKLCKPVNAFDYCSVPEGTFNFIQQTARWFAGELTLLKKRKKPVLIVKRIYDILFWPLGAVTSITIMWISLNQGNVPSLIVLLVAGALYIHIHTKTRNIFKKHNFFSLLLIPLHAIRVPIGPIYGLIRTILSKIIPYQFEKTAKTNRDSHE